MIFLIQTIWLGLKFQDFKEDDIIKKFNLLLSMIIYSSIECLLYTLLLIILERDISPKNTYRWPTNISKDGSASLFH